MAGSSTLREILAVKLVLLSLVPKLTGSSAKWFTDNQNVPRILTCGSRKTHLRSEALDIYHICVNNGISIEMEWIPRNQNEQADYLSRFYDPDDWGLSLVSFRTIDEVWGPHILWIDSLIFWTVSFQGLTLDTGILARRILIALCWIGKARTTMSVRLFHLFQEFFFIWKTVPQWVPWLCIFGYQPLLAYAYSRWYSFQRFCD